MATAMAWKNPGAVLVLVGAVPDVGGYIMGFSRFAVLASLAR
jgi:hypothetical protein